MTKTKVVNNEVVELTAEDEKEIEEQTKQSIERAKTIYKEKRIFAYPEIGDQLDALYHAGVFPKEMADKIKAVKDANPKP